jgi:hypothetical protein
MKRKAFFNERLNIKESTVNGMRDRITMQGPVHVLCESCKETKQTPRPFYRVPNATNCTEWPLLESSSERAPSKSSLGSLLPSYAQAALKSLQHSNPPPPDITVIQWYSTLFVRVPPHVITLQLCTPQSGWSIIQVIHSLQSTYKIN